MNGQVRERKVLQLYYRYYYSTGRKKRENVPHESFIFHTTRIAASAECDWTHWTDWNDIVPGVTMTVDRKFVYVVSDS